MAGLGLTDGLGFVVFRLTAVLTVTLSDFGVTDFKEDSTFPDLNDASSKSSSSELTPTELLFAEGSTELAFVDTALIEFCTTDSSGRSPVSYPHSSSVRHGSSSITPIHSFINNFAI